MSWPLNTKFLHPRPEGVGIKTQHQSGTSLTMNNPVCETMLSKVSVVQENLHCSDRYPYFEMEIHGPVISLKPDENFELESGRLYLMYHIGH